MIENAGLWGLFLSSFISSTLLPGGSEVLLGYLVREQSIPPWQLLLAAISGNTLGGLVTFAMGWLLSVRWPMKAPEKKSQQRALTWIHNYGPAALLLSWLPVIGDPLCFIAGWLRLNLIGSALLILVGKSLRYLLIVMAMS